MSDELSNEEIREYAYKLWQDAGSPEGHAEEFWVKARELLAKQHGDAHIDAASEQSFPASDAINHM